MSPPARSDHHAKKSILSSEEQNYSSYNLLNPTNEGSHFDYPDRTNES